MCFTSVNSFSSKEGGDSVAGTEATLWVGQPRNCHLIPIRDITFSSPPKQKD